MKTRTRLTDNGLEGALRRRCLASAALVALAVPLTALPALAQEGTQGGGIEEIVVTGSRIQRSNLTAPTPVQVIDAATIQLKGSTNAAELINELPAAGVPGVSTTNSNFLVSATGLNLVDLRNLGTERTLVLVNGRRHVGGIEGSTSVDLNSIPSDFIERVEVVTGGASAVYGSEAIAGVVNIILKRDFQGASFSAQTGVTGEGDGENYNASATFGSNFAEDRGNIIVNFTYDKTNEVESKDRSISEVDAFSSADGVISRPALSSYGPGGRFIIPGVGNRNPDGTPFATAVNGYNRNQDRLIAVPIERYLLSTITRYDLVEDVSFFFEGTYARTETSSRSEPIAFGDNTTIGVGIDAPVLSIPVTNPFIPAGLRSLIPAGTDEILFARRFNEIGPRESEITRQTFRFATGFEGELANGWNWQTYYQFGKVTQDQISTGVFNVVRMQEALNAEVGPGGALQCSDALARAQGCVPLNVFGAGTATGPGLDYVTANSTFDSTIQQQTAGAFLSGDVVELPAGALGAAVGLEWRKEESEFRPDALSIAGISSGNQSAFTAGEYDVWEAYAETVIPILAGLPFVESLSVEGAIRYADYSTIGNVWAYKAGAEYQPVPDVRLRGVWSRAVRAPNIGELFTPPRQTFVSVNDPCAGVTAGATDTVSANCLATPGIAQAVAAGGFNPTQLDLSSIPGFNSGNSTLQEEKADTLTLGVVFTPSFIPGLALTVDYFDIDIKDAIQGFGTQTTVDQCVQQTAYPDNIFCNLIRRDPSTGLIVEINSQQENVATQTAKGVDVELDYRFDLADGSLNLNLIGTYLIENENVPFEGADPVESAGSVGLSKYRFNLRTTYDQGPLTFSWLLRYIGAANIDNESEFPSNRIGSHIYNDIQARYRVAEGYTVFAGIDNLLNEKPPLIASPFDANVTGTETAADVYDPVGRFFYVGVRAEF